MATPKIVASRTIPQDIQSDLICIAVLERNIEESCIALQNKLEEIAPRLASAQGFVAGLIREHNARIAKRDRKAVRT